MHKWTIALLVVRLASALTFGVLAGEHEEVLASLDKLPAAVKEAVLKMTSARGRKEKPSTRSKPLARE